MINAHPTFSFFSIFHLSKFRKSINNSKMWMIKNETENVSLKPEQTLTLLKSENKSRTTLLNMICGKQIQSDSGKPQRWCSASRQTLANLSPTQRIALPSQSQNKWARNLNTYHTKNTQLVGVSLLNLLIISCPWKPHRKKTFFANFLQFPELFSTPDLFLSSSPQGTALRRQSQS